MDFVKLVLGAVLLVTFAGALMVRDQPPGAVAAMPLPAICGDVQADHGAAAMQAHLDTMAAATGEAHAALIQTMEPMHSDMMRAMTAADFQTAFVCSMIPHHQGAVEMAQVAQAYSSDPWVLMFAQEIIAAQQVEIGEMQTWLARRP